MKLIIKCRGYEGELIKIKPDIVSTYPDGSYDIRAYKVTLENAVGDIIHMRNVTVGDMKLDIREY